MHILHLPEDTLLSYLLDATVLLSIKVTLSYQTATEVSRPLSSSCLTRLMEGVVSGCLCSDVLSSLSPSLLHASALDKKADCTITMADSDLLALMTGKMNPQSVSTGAPTLMG